MHHTTRNYLIPISIGTLLAIAAFISVLWFVDPFASGLVQYFFFYLTLFLASTGILTLTGIIIRKKVSPGMFTEQLRISFRQGVLLSFLILGLLILQVSNLLLWWVGLTLVLFIIALEVFLNS